MIHRRHLLRTAALLPLAAAWPLRAQEPPYRAVDLDWGDSTRNRPVPVRLYLPNPAPSVAERAPLVVFSHGIGGSRRGYSYLGAHFATHGIASLHLQHVGSDRALWGGSVFSLVDRLQSAASEAEALARVGDLRFALDQLRGSPWGERLQLDRIVAAGHSYGANTTLLASGARVEREGQPVPLRDERVAAAIVISAPPFYGESDLQRILAPVTVPSLHVTATEDVIRIPGYYSGVSDRLKVFEATGSRDKWLAVFNGGSHSLFTGRAGEASSVVVATRELALAFVRKVLQQDGRALAAWPQQHAALVERFVAPRLQGGATTSTLMRSGSSQYSA